MSVHYHVNLGYDSIVHEGYQHALSPETLSKTE
jgi:hypothetical protein